MYKINSLLIIYFVMPFIQTMGQKVNSESIIGEWCKGSTNNQYCYIFYPNRDYKEFFESIDLFNSWGKVKYEVKLRNDTTWLVTTYKKANVNGRWIKNFTDRRVIWLNGDFISIALYKKGAGINNHIDEYSVLVRKTEYPQKIEFSGPRITYIIPEGYNGSVWIAFNQTKGIPPTYDSLGNPILKIPSNGLLETTLHEDVFATANGYYNIVEESKTGKGLKKFKSFDKVDNIDSTCCNPDSYYAFMGGFNQITRESINLSVFNKSINGNVMTIFIGKYNWFKQNWLHPWDSKRE